MEDRSNSRQVNRVVRVFIVEVAIYGVLLFVYFLLVLRFLDTPLVNLFSSNLTLYAFVALGLIIAQGVLLDFITGLFVKLLRLDHIE